MKYSPVDVKTRTFRTGDYLVTWAGGRKCVVARSKEKALKILKDIRMGVNTHVYLQLVVKRDHGVFVVHQIPDFGA
jgi:hypothetical protein